MKIYTLHKATQKQIQICVDSTLRFSICSILSIRKDRRALWIAVSYTTSSYKQLLLTVECGKHSEALRLQKKCSKTGSSRSWEERLPKVLLKLNENCLLFKRFIKLNSAWCGLHWRERLCRRDLLVSYSQVTRALLCRRRRWHLLDAGVEERWRESDLKIESKFIWSTQKRFLLK